MSQSNNLIHVSDSEETATAEEKRFFKSGEFFDWKRALTPLVYGEDELK